MRRARWSGTGMAMFFLAVAMLVAPAGAQVAPGDPPPPDSTSSSPPDLTEYSRPIPPSAVAVQEGAGATLVTDPSVSAATIGGSEPSIAVNPANPNQIVITRFSFGWATGNAAVLYSADGGVTWTQYRSIPPPPGRPTELDGCPCDQTIDYGRDGRLYGAFLLCMRDAMGNCTTTRVVSGSTTDPTQASAWSWNGDPAQATSGARIGADQPWLLVNRDPAIAGQDDVYVAYDDFAAGPDARVAVSYGANPVNFTNDQRAGLESPLATNPGLRMAADPRNGTMYVLYEQSTGGVQPKNVTYRLNRSTDGGLTWTLNGNVNGIAVAVVPSDQAPGFKHGGVNALLGGVDHVAVDPVNGDVYVAYGENVAGGTNRIRIRRLQDNGVGGLNVGPPSTASVSNDSALPSVAVLTDGTVGVLYDSFDGTSSSGFPQFTAHLARSSDRGVTFTDQVLQTFESPATDNGNSRQRVLGDYQQMKAVGATFYGVFSGNRSGFASGTSRIDPIFFKDASAPPACTSALTGDQTGPFTVGLGQHLCFSGARVVGPVTVNAGGALTLLNTQVSGGVTSNGAAFVRVCGSKITAGLTVNASVGNVTVGDPGGGCAMNQFSSPGVGLTGNQAGLVFGGNASVGPVNVNNNVGGPVIVKANTVYGDLNCTGNVPPPTNAGQANTAIGGVKTGQCAGL